MCLIRLMFWALGRPEEENATTHCRAFRAVDFVLLAAGWSINSTFMFVLYTSNKSAGETQAPSDYNVQRMFYLLLNFLVSASLCAGSLGLNLSYFVSDAFCSIRSNKQSIFYVAGAAIPIITGGVCFYLSWKNTPPPEVVNDKHMYSRDEFKLLYVMLNVSFLTTNLPYLIRIFQMTIQYFLNSELSDSTPSTASQILRHVSSLQLMTDLYVILFVFGERLRDKIIPKHDATIRTQSFRRMPLPNYGAANER
eukprot:TRINITY_DN951_c0_g1_i2.p1 TRINITY_DN951_c0_g1~~TRINITY_DN951_c0_g1_i2.p1  ORF type:complete len:252 (-),score=6.16 TRINITY_DN951_c0_g1_i2:233-988(-)